VSLKRRLERLESDRGRYEGPAHYAFDPSGSRPRDLMYRVLFKGTERWRARPDGREVPAYS
jgi:hypothetical protein